ncbi:hypothetical protein BCR34DRAFT_602992 [Clohesyomyces aquaticus]|uniref:Uncharacterized protein n=1 Tax=Clohesyomyces aquaticus TaxID=1231657 RepID=A0A1Y1ZG81_9PLEO|nr:hypothetical protein BCR34DRAFT_602992 [Clohesyomyces aquaticus]
MPAPGWDARGADSTPAVDAAPEVSLLTALPSGLDHRPTPWGNVCQLATLEHDKRGVISASPDKLNNTPLLPISRHLTVHRQRTSGQCNVDTRLPFSMNHGADRSVWEPCAIAGWDTPRSAVQAARSQLQRPHKASQASPQGMRSIRTLTPVDPSFV